MCSRIRDRFDYANRVSETYLQKGILVSILEVIRSKLVSPLTISEEMIIEGVNVNSATIGILSGTAND